MIADFSFMSRDSIHVNMITRNRKFGNLVESDDVFILDDSILNDEESMKILEQFADEFAKCKEEMQSNFANAKHYLNLSTVDKKTYIEALRLFSRTRSLTDIEKLCPIDDLIRCLKVQGKNWSKYTRLFDSPVLKWKDWIRKTLLGVCIPTWLISFLVMLFTWSAGSFGIMLVSLSFSAIATGLPVDIDESEKVVAALRECVGSDYYDMLDYRNDEIPQLSKEKKTNRNVEAFADFVKADIEFIKKHGDRDFTSEIGKLGELSKKYFNSLSNSHNEDRVFLEALLEIEESLYATSKIGMKKEMSTALNVESFRKRLMFAGLSEEDLNTTGIKKILDVVATLCANPFYGVEVKIVSLLKEVCFRLSGGSKSDEAYEDALQGLSIARQYDSLMGVLGELEDHLSEAKARESILKEKDKQQGTCLTL